MEDNRSNELWEVSVAMCEILSCENCPVVIQNADYRTKHEKENMHVSCCENLYKWLDKVTTAKNTTRKIEKVAEELFGNMRDAKPEEQESVNKYIESISIGGNTLTRP